MNPLQSVLPRSPKRTAAPNTTKWSSMVAAAERFRRIDHLGVQEPDATVDEKPEARKSEDYSSSARQSSANVLGGRIPILPVMVPPEEVRMLLARRSESRHRVHSAFPNDVS